MLQFIIKDVLGTPAILVGLFSLFGLLLQKKPVSDVISGTLKTIMGFVILIAGANLIAATLTIFSQLFEHSFNIQGVVPNTDAMAALAQKSYGTETAMIMVFGMLVNILLARITPLKYIFLTGHHTLYMSAMLAVILSVGGIHGFWLVLIGSLILGTMMVVCPAILQPFTRKITNSDDLALGHFGSTGYLLSALVGKVVGKGSPSIEELKVPKTLNFLRDSSVAISLTMMILFIALVLVAGKEFTESISGGQNYIVFAIIQSITFAAGVYIILAGVRMVIAEIVPAFKGIADKLVPNAKPALDCPTVFPFAPNAVIIGFLSSFSAGLISMFLCPLFGLSVIVPGLVPHFFCGATAGVYGNITGGRRGAVIGAFVQGLLISFLPAILLPLMGDLGFASTTFGDADFGIVGIVLGHIISFFH
ncbi:MULTISPECIES: PTS ascorbate transporter subunit IIC [Enterobacterales]|jgi:PTS system ascorbate-specific IIC component|uniref:Ascorbate-specific PTS system EIIC component n=1 Tax=Candidatus Pantoea symbiotica TaxID=1884370 RepID=A0A1I4BS94_9GAMM|nr:MULTISPECIES: PTS ascorbate transporter subunit IIC [Enterobacterales]MRS21560.1 PTS ascorbate transporter subunit IIC [Enterobacteriaceae bacterium RIT692]MRT24510.1 PTS ascorbate transporter subunit IIC [Enterobacteriaceae bacterium RIT697]MRT43116.1 PTS ascorbate transporter subunit IIC [Enterobacteriaceae bacterium RIT702]KAJ9431132.1 PTS ascorbate transporter subunit IIC [Pantoea sp. YR343]MBB3307552.1 PTS system ascorbate-specific IIC component [Enterobacter sp. Sphag1F]